MTTNRIDMIRTRLESSLSPSVLEIEDDSAAHKGHAGAKNGGGHFNIIIKSEQFEGKSLIQQHRMVYEAVDDIMHTEIHALSIKSSLPSK